MDTRRHGARLCCDDGAGGRRAHRELPVKDNQFVHNGDLLMVIDPTDYKIAVSLNEALQYRGRSHGEPDEKSEGSA